MVSGGALLVGGLAQADGLSDAVSSANADFLTTTGFSIGSLVTQLTDWVVSIIGSAVGLITALLPVIKTIVIVSVIVYVLYRCFKWFHVF